MLARMTGKSLRHDLASTSWTVLALGTCAALAVLFTTVALDVGQKMNRTLRRLGANATAVAERTPEDWEVVEHVAGEAGVSLVRLEVRVATIQGAPVAVVAADPSRLAALTPYWAVSGHRPEAVGECLVGRRAADRFELREGSEVRLRWSGDTGPHRLRVTGVLRAGDEDDDRLFVVRPPGPTAPVVRSYALLSVPDGEDGISRLARELRRRKAGVVVRPLRQIVHGEGVVLSRITLLTGLTVAAVLVLTAMGVTATVLSRVRERREELALLRALGARTRAVVGLLLAESLALGVAGSILGFVAGTALAEAVLARVFGVPAGPHPAALAAGLVVSLGVATAAGSAGARRALRGEPAAALRGE